MLETLTSSQDNNKNNYEIKASQIPKNKLNKK